MVVAPVGDVAAVCRQVGAQMRLAPLGRLEGPAGVTRIAPAGDWRVTVRIRTHAALPLEPAAQGSILTGGVRRVQVRAGDAPPAAGAGVLLRLRYQRREHALQVSTWLHGRFLIWAQGAATVDRLQSRLAV